MTFTSSFDQVIDYLAGDPRYAAVLPLLQEARKDLLDKQAKRRRKQNRDAKQRSRARQRGMLSPVSTRHADKRNIPPHPPKEKYISHAREGAVALCDRHIAKQFEPLLGMEIAIEYLRWQAEQGKPVTLVTANAHLRSLKLHADPKLVVTRAIAGNWRNIPPP